MLENGLEINANESPEARMSIALTAGTPILEGLLIKKNKWRMKQERRFFLYADGRVTYFKDLEQKGTMNLTKDSKARKVNRYELEVTLPALKRTYILLQGDLNKMPQSKEGFSCRLDDWVDSINNVI